MNNKFVLSAAAAIIFAATPALATEKVSGGVIQFTGAVTDTTCTVNGGNPNNMTVALAPITAEIASDGNSLIDEGKAPFSIELSNCAASTTAGSKLNIRFTSDKIDNTGKYLINSDASSAKAGNIGIAIVKKGDTTPLDLRGKTATTIADDKSTETVNFFAHYYRPATGPVTPGNVAAMVTYSLSYL
ncbi:fimbrial protein [Providencia sneebia]|uniref:Fimbrial-type adhesion domain-containing protein n=1 Tax=Providencia sneebia DSM 19967 TaxID=1141660 RepID=K8WLU8_9GAMM|nr:fimbrial protein [Providencia sneebia]EKT60921.1 hypothetical protein OO7_02491 [Providencia sneebia DSM 19967]